MDIQEGLPKLVQVFPKDGHQGHTTIDVIAVHGIETHSPKTWIAYEQDEEPRGRATNWLCDEDMLPQEMPQARIWTYDYNSNCYSDNAQEVDILGLGETFLEILWRAKDKNVGNRPFLFVGSCFGGIVITQALERASRDRKKYANILKFIAGVVFLGTPLRGTETASIAKWVALIRGFMGKETSGIVLRSLENKASSLDNLVQDFARMAIEYKLQIRCFYETRKTQIANAVSRQISSFFRFGNVKLVPKESASLDGHKRFPLDVRHAMMNKFRGPKDPNFMLISGSLDEMAKSFCKSQSLTEEEKKCIQCLASNYREAKDRNEQRVPGTCKWVLEHPKFIDWQKGIVNLLWVSADPGCGKSVLLRALIDEGLVSNVNECCVCYFFFKDDDESRKNSANALCAILHQLFVQKPTLLEHATPYYRNNGEKLRTMFRDLWEILILCAKNIEAGEIVCVLDALDECGEESRKDLISALGQFRSRHKRADTRLKILATSRPYDDVEKLFRGSIEDVPTISLKGEYESEKISQEIDLVIDYQIPRISKARDQQLDLDVQKSLVESLKKVPHRTYLWLHLVLDQIRNSLDSTFKRLRRPIDNLPRSVEDAYEKILNRINDSDNRIPARRLLHIIVAAIRPLTLDEMNIALAIDENLQEREDFGLSWGDLGVEPEQSFRHKIRNICGLFISISSSKVYLIHQTAREFLISKDLAISPINRNHLDREAWRHSLNSVESNLIIVKICLCYLLLREHNDQIDKVHIIDWKYVYRGGGGWIDHSLDFGTFMDYAAHHWVAHFGQAGIRENDLLLLQAAIGVCDVVSNRFRLWSGLSGVRDRVGRISTFSTLTVASFLGLEAVVRQLLKTDGVDANFTDDRGRSPLLWAVDKGHAGIVKLLLETNHVDPNLVDSQGESPLLLAAKKGRAGIVKLLLENFHVHPSVKIRKTNSRPSLPSLAADQNRKYGKVDQLRRQTKGVELNWKDYTEQKTALTWAAYNGHCGVIKLLLEANGIEINSQDRWGQTALFLAAENGHVEIVKLLLKTDGMEVNSQDELGQTALISAASNGHVEIVKLLLETEGIEINSQNEQGQTAFSYAAQNGHFAVVKLLLETNGIEINSQDEWGQTALFFAAENGHVEIVELLLETNGIGISSPNKRGRTPLFLAAENGHVEIVKLLLETNGIEINSQDKEGQTAFFGVVENGYVEIVKLLLEKNGIGINSQNKEGQTALSLAAENGYVEVVKLLLETHGIKINSRDNWGRTALSSAARMGYVGAVKLLLETNGIKINSRDNWGRTALSLAAENGYVEIVKLLLETNGIKINFQDISGQTAFSLAAENGYVEIVKLLLETDGIDVYSQDMWGRTALSLAKENGHDEIVDLLTRHSASHLQRCPFPSPRVAN